jgi:SAM-dependent methyltransferase
MNKHHAELAYFRREWERFGGRFRNDYFRTIMLAMAEEPCDDFIDGKIIADFGCGPRGSLIWASKARLRIGIDVLADQYAEAFYENFLEHEMIYLKSTETVIPLPSNFVDILFTINAIDHVDSFPAMCSEVIRIIKPGGEFIGSFNLGEYPTPTEPQCLDEELIHRHLLNKLDILSYRLTGRKQDKNSTSANRYSPFFSGNMLPFEKGQEGVLWIRAMKPS